MLQKQLCSVSFQVVIYSISLFTSLIIMKIRMESDVLMNVGIFHSIVCPFSHAESRKCSAICEDWSSMHQRNVMEETES